MFPTPIKQTAPWVRIGYQLLLPVALFIWLFPLIGVAVTSVRPAADLAAGNYFGIPSSFAGVENYTAVFRNSPIGWFILNSFLVTIPTVIGAVSLSCLTGFALAIYKFKSNLLVFFMFVAGNFVPFQILMVPVRDLTLKMGLYDSIMGLVLFHVAFQTGFCNIVLPLMRPAIAALSVLIFTFIWNDYFWATVMIQGQHAMPVTAGLYSLNGQWVAQWHLVSAGSIVAALPPVAMFFLMQKHFIAGLTLGATKG
jgi:multiple sugar transport system permease protein